MRLRRRRRFFKIVELYENVEALYDCAVALYDRAVALYDCAEALYYRVEALYDNPKPWEFRVSRSACLAIVSSSVVLV
jgi:hypothetical protein